jgi:hypothetical protein
MSHLMQAYVAMTDTDDFNEHYRKALRSTLKLCPEAARLFNLNQMTLINAMILAWVAPEKQHLYLDAATTNPASSLIYLVRREQSS